VDHQINYEKSLNVDNKVAKKKFQYSSNQL